MESKQQTSHDGSNRQWIWWLLLLVCGLLMCGLCLTISLMSPQFADSTRQTDRPILTVLGMFAGAFVVYLLSLFFALKIHRTGKVVWFVLAVSVICRIVLIGSFPFQEIDAYRYIWDGNVSNAGISPYQYSPKQAKQATIQSSDENLQRIARLRSRDPGLDAILHRVHFAELSTAYPTVSQSVFWASAKTTPLVSMIRNEESHSLHSHLISMKMWITFFDLGTLALVCLLLNTVRIHPGWAIAYGWCPLVLKELSNTGHLDSIAIFFCVLSLFILVKFVLSRFDQPKLLVFAFSAGVGLAVALGVGAKLFPVILVPLISLALLRKSGWITALLFTTVALANSYMFLRPVLIDSTIEQISQTDQSSEAADPDASGGLYEFLTRWRMNDFIFMNVQENVEHPVVYEEKPSPWFVIVPDSNRKAIHESVHLQGNKILKELQVAMGKKADGELFQFEKKQTSFLIARATTLALFSLIAFWVAWRGTHALKTVPDSNALRRVLEAAFLTLAWFWLTAPTQNPWYWCWAMPLICFARNRWWLVLSLCAMVYYLRFWFRYHMADSQVLGTEYNGTQFFDFVVTWIEFGPFLLILVLTACWSRIKKSRTSSVEI